LQFIDRRLIVPFGDRQVVGNALDGGGWRRVAGVGFGDPVAPYEPERRADHEDERGGQRKPRKAAMAAEWFRRDVLFFTELRGDAQPGVVRRLDLAERAGGIADLLEVGHERAAGL